MLLAGEIVFKNVKFGYPGKPHTLNGVSFTINGGSNVGLTGASWASAA